MAEYKDKIPAAGGKVDFLYDPKSGTVSTQISGFGLRAIYLVAVSMDGRHLLAHVPATGIGQIAIYPKPSVLTFIQSDDQGMWGRSCPICKKYFRTDHIEGGTFCPYCFHWDSSLAFVSEDQKKYITACYDTFARAMIFKTNTSVEMKEITDSGSAWHYSEEKQQHYFSCCTERCGAHTDILGQYGYCPRCGLTNARKLFTQQTDKMLTRLEEMSKAVSERDERSAHWEEMTKAILSNFEPLARHLRIRLLCFPMTAHRKKQLEALNFQRPLDADEALAQWLDIGFLRWAGNDQKPPRLLARSDVSFIKKMIQKRHILIHNGGIVDQEYLDLSGDNSVRLGERIRVRSNEARHFIECIRTMAENLLDGVEYGFEER